MSVSSLMYIIPLIKNNVKYNFKELKLQCKKRRLSILIYVIKFKINKENKT